MSLEVQHVSKTFGSDQALRDVNLKIEDGESSGKTFGTELPRPDYLLF